MNKPHASLKASTNILLILVWGMVTVALLLFLEPFPILIVMAGIVFGLAGGLMQAYSFKESKVSFKSAKTMMEVRKAIKNTKWGKRYIVFLWFGYISLVTIAFTSTNDPLLSVLAGYFLLMFIREIITLKPTIELNREIDENIA